MRELNTIISVLISITIGALCAPIFYWIYDIVASFDVEHKFLKWIIIVPKDYRYAAGLFHSFMVEMIAAIPIISIAGIILGYLVKEKALLFGCIATAAYFVCDSIYSSILFNVFVFSHYLPSIWYTIASVIAWFSYFILMTRVGTALVVKISQK